MLDNLKTRIKEYAIKRVVKKKLGYDVDPSIGDLSITQEGDSVTVHVDLSITMDEDVLHEIMDLIKDKAK